jgi:hypothetical protein
MHQIINERVDTMMATIIKMMEKKAGPERMKQIEGGSSKSEDEEAQREEVQDPWEAVRMKNDMRLVGVYEHWGTVIDKQHGLSFCLPLFLSVLNQERARCRTRDPRTV